MYIDIGEVTVKDLKSQKEALAELIASEKEMCEKFMPNEKPSRRITDLEKLLKLCEKIYIELGISNLTEVKRFK